MENSIDLAGDVHVVGDIYPNKAEVLMLDQVCNVLWRSGDKVIEANDRPSVFKKSLADVRTKKSGPTGYDCASALRHEARVTLLQAFGRKPVMMPATASAIELSAATWAVRGPFSGS